MRNDLRYALRVLRQHPWFSAAIIGTLALGIGVNTTVFTLVNAVLYKPFPAPNGDRLVAVVANYPAQGRNVESVPFPDLIDLRSSVQSLEHLEGYAQMGIQLTEQANPPERYRAAWATAGLFNVIGAQAVAGRLFLPSDELPGAESVMLISHGVWKDRYGASPSVIGRTVRANDKPAVIVGVLPEGVKFPQGEDVWLNLKNEEDFARRDNRSIFIVGLRKPGVSIIEAQADLAVAARRLEQQYPDSHRGHGFNVLTFHELMNAGRIRQVFLTMLAAVAFVLLIACANVANMLLGRALGRRREISIRVALGASRLRVVRQLLVESLVFSFLGGLLGLAFTQGAVNAFSRAVADVGKPYWILFETNYQVFLYFAGICLTAGLLFGTVPALHASRVDVNESLKDGAKSSGGRSLGLFSGALVVFQFALAVVLLTAAGLMIRSFLAAQSEFSWLNGEQILHARVQLPESRYATKEQRIRFYDELLPKLGAIPGVRQAIAVSNYPGSGAYNRRIEMAAHPEPEFEKLPYAAQVIVMPGYLEMIGLRVLQGRDLRADDGLPGKENLLVSREFAEKYFPGENPVGQKVRIFQGNKSPHPWMTVVGVFPEYRQNDPGNTIQGPLVLIPQNWDASYGMALLLRTGASGTALTPALRNAVREMDPNLPLFEVDTLESRMARSRWHLRVFGTLFAVFALIALGMAAVGIYAVLAHATTLRTREIGVRMALGARASSIITMVLRRGLIQLGLGMALGLTGAYFLAGFMRVLLLGTSPHDPVTFLIVALTLFTTGCAACLLPARRASRLDPLDALRHE